MRSSGTRREWSIITTGGTVRWGGDARRQYIFRALAGMTRAREVHGFSIETLRGAFPPHDDRVVGERRTVASAELLGANALGVLRDRADLAVVDLHDHPLLQLETLGMTIAEERRQELTAVFERNTSSFELLVAPSRTFATLARLDLDKVLVAPNGTETVAMPAAPLPHGHTIGMASGAAPGRGIETLIDAVGLLRRTRADVRLLLWLVGTGEDSDRYLEGLRERIVSHDWARIETVPYDSMCLAMSQVSVLCVPHPRSPYMDAVLPIKLADSMGSGRPVVVTPCTEMAEMVERARAGVVARGDTADDLAAAIDSVFAHPHKAHKMARAARRFAQRELDWRVIGKRLARQILGRIA
ncbi:MAG TPA: glycosyltransferase [Actinomycetota bacterium]|nr:glycosyltransferase [Actinomycetota bacterium]